VDNVPVDVLSRPEGLLVTMIGSFLPNDQRLGGVRWMMATNDSSAPGPMVLSGLPRTTHTTFTDLNGDGRPDLIACQFGNNIGHFSWHEAMADGSWQEHVLLKKPGALTCDVRDFNGDGTPDIAVLIAQETEALLLFYNNGTGVFTM